MDRAAIKPVDVKIDGLSLSVMKAMMRPAPGIEEPILTGHSLLAPDLVSDTKAVLA